MASVPLSNVLLKPKSHMSFSNTKGLLNGPGENNCFLNSAVQVGHGIGLRSTDLWINGPNDWMNGSINNWLVE